MEMETTAYVSEPLPQCIKPEHRIQMWMRDIFPHTVYDWQRNVSHKCCGTDHERVNINIEP